MNMRARTPILTVLAVAAVLITVRCAEDSDGSAGVNAGYVDADTTIYAGETPGLLVLRDADGPVLRWESSSSGVWLGMTCSSSECEPGPLYESTAFRAVIMVDGIEHASAPALVTVAQFGDTLRVLSPNGGEVYRIGDTLTVRWLANSRTVARAGVDISLDDGDVWFTISDRALPTDDPRECRLTWVVPATLVNYPDIVPTVSSLCRVRVYQYGQPIVMDASDALFVIQ